MRRIEPGPLLSSSLAGSGSQHGKLSRGAGAYCDRPPGHDLGVIAPERDPAHSALEALALEGYRSDRLSEFDIQQLLGIETRMEVHGFLKNARRLSPLRHGGSGARHARGRPHRGEPEQA